MSPISMKEMNSKASNNALTFLLKFYNPGI